MNRDDFLRDLEFYLRDLPQAEREEALQYYRDYLDDAGVEKEAEVLASLGTPEQVAASIRKDNAGAASDYVPNQDFPIVEYGTDTTKQPENNQPKLTYHPIILILIVIGALVVGGVVIGGITGMLGGLFGLICGWFGIILGFGAAALGLFLATLALIIASIPTFFASITAGLALFGAGLLCLGLALFFFVLCMLMAVYATPAIWRILKGAFVWCKDKFVGRNTKGGHENV